MLCTNCGEEIGDAKICPNCGNTIDSEPTENEGKDTFCTNCGSKLPENISFCPSCGASTTPKENQTNNRNNTKFCQNCGSKIDEKAIICPKCGVSTGKSNSNKKMVIALILNIVLGWFIPGIGQIYLGLTKKGIIMIVIYVICLMTYWLIIPGILALIIFIYAIIDAIISGQAIAKGEPVEDSLFGFSF